MSDESIVNLSDTSKAKMRNYAMVAGFMILFINAAIRASIIFANKTPPEALGMNNYVFFSFLIGASLMIVGAILAFLHKRDLVAITFILLSVMMMISPTMNLMYGSNNALVRYPALIVAVILGVAMLFTRNEQKYVCVLVLLPYSIFTLVYGINSIMSISAVAYVIQAAVSLYSAFCIGLENPRFPGYTLLTADEEDETKDGSPVHFKVSGSILGYSLLMMPAICVIFGYLDIFNVHGVASAPVNAYEFSCGLMMVFVGFLMLAAGRMKFTPFLFMMIGVSMALHPFVNIIWPFLVYLIAIGSMCLLRSDRRILLGATVILIGLLYLFIPGGVYPCVQIEVAIDVAVVLMMSYLCFALCSDNRLKLI